MAVVEGWSQNEKRKHEESLFHSRLIGWTIHIHNVDEKNRIPFDEFMTPKGAEADKESTKKALLILKAFREKEKQDQEERLKNTINDNSDK